jgi:hypothetical protein
MSAERGFDRGGHSPERLLGQRGENALIRSASLFDGGICHAMRKCRGTTLRREQVERDVGSHVHALAWEVTVQVSSQQPWDTSPGTSTMSRVDALADVARCQALQGD